MMGGGEIIASFLDEETIDKFIIGVIPTFIGEGIQNYTSRAPVLRRPAQMRLTVAALRSSRFHRSPESRLSPLVPLCPLFRNPELGHELGTKSAEGNVASGGSGAVIAAIVGGNSFHRTSMIVRATPATRSRTTLIANAIGDSNNANRPKTTNHTGMIAVRLNSIDMVVNFFHRGLRTRGTRTAVAVHTGRTDVSISGCDLKDLGDLSDLVLNVARNRACGPAYPTSGLRP